ncbi:MAG TPA: TetR/AcrR family transcriptional regulator [Nocardioidaceae bacterium]|nr:TetR/AcrR family transcriptional regulator [Nocardioidaceae bacterium]
MSNDRPAGKRRVPQQSRSIERVERILDAAAELVVAEGVDALTTRAVADLAEVPVASLYQYFADKDEILLALVERDVAEMDAQVAADLARLEVLSVASIVETTMRAFVKVYLRRPAFVVIWLRGRTNTAINEFCRAHNKRVAADLFRLARDAGLVRPGTKKVHAELAVEVGDRVFQLAFETRMRGDKVLVSEGVELVRSYLERHASQAGIEGVPA